MGGAWVFGAVGDAGQSAGGVHPGGGQPAGGGHRACGVHPGGAKGTAKPCGAVCAGSAAGGVAGVAGAFGLGGSSQKGRDGEPLNSLRSVIPCH